MHEICFDEPGKGERALNNSVCIVSQTPELLQISSAVIPKFQQAAFDFGAYATRVAHRRRAARACAAMEKAA